MYIYIHIFINITRARVHVCAIRIYRPRITETSVYTEAECYSVREQYFLFYNPGKWE